MAPTEPVFTGTDTNDEYEVERILAHRGTKTRREYLIKWLNYPDFENSWEPEVNLSNADDVLMAYKRANRL